MLKTPHLRTNLIGLSCVKFLGVFSVIIPRYSVFGDRYREKVDFPFTITLHDTAKCDYRGVSAIPCYPNVTVVHDCGFD